MVPLVRGTLVVVPVLVLLPATSSALLFLSTGPLTAGKMVKVKPSHISSTEVLVQYNTRNSTGTSTTGTGTVLVLEWSLAM
jgi:hypothetical protein